MIQIGTRIWITDDLTGDLPGMSNTGATQVYLDGEVIGGIQHIKMEWSAGDQLANKWCTVSNLSERFNPLVEAFAMELAEHGFSVEVINRGLSYNNITEYYHLKDGAVIREEKKSCLAFSKSKENEASSSSQ